MQIRTIDMPMQIGNAITLHGWLHQVRRLGGVNFVLLRDGWGVAQAVTEDVTMLEGLTAGTILELSGEVVEAKQVALGCEIIRPKITVLEPISEQPPLTLHKSTLKANLPTLLDNAVVANRHPTRQALLRLSAAAMTGFRKTLTQLHFTEIQSPKLVASATESGADVFRLGYYENEAFLAQSPQFYKQIMVGVLERVFEVGPVFRAEPHNTSRHLAEYVSLDVELGFINDHFDVMRIVQQALRGMFAEMGVFSAELSQLNLTLPSVPSTIPHIQFHKAQQLIWEQHKVDVRGEPDLSPQDERWLGTWAQAEHGSDFLFIVGYPMSKRPFYTHPTAENPDASNSFDLLFRGMELITGGQRLHRYADYEAALARANMPLEPFRHYLDAFKYGMPAHGGFAIGLERLMMQLTGASNIRKVTLFPRDMARLSP